MNSVENITTLQQVCGVMQKLGKNKFLVQTLAGMLPAHRNQVSAGTLQQMGAVTGFTPVEVFRKYAPRTTPCSFNLALLLRSGKILVL